MTQAIRVGIVDSGVHLNHPHVGGIVGGVTVDSDAYLPEFIDRMGHGTAIAALIHHLAPSAELVAVRIFDRTLATSIQRVVRAIDWCLDHNIQIVNLSLGTVNPDHRAVFEAAIERVKTAGAALVSAYEMGGRPMLPGSMPGVIGVTSDPELSHEKSRCVELGGKRVFSAPPFPLEIPGVPREHNLNGVSFAVAHVSAHLARLGSHFDTRGEWEQVLLSGVGISASG